MQAAFVPHAKAQLLLKIYQLRLPVTCGDKVGVFVGGHYAEGTLCGQTGLVKRHDIEAGLYVLCNCKPCMVENPYRRLSPAGPANDGGCLFTVGKFEQHAGKERSRKWKRTIRQGTNSLEEWMAREGALLGQGVLDRAVAVFWPLDGERYAGKVLKYSDTDNLHLVQYSDGDQEWLHLAVESHTATGSSQPAIYGSPEARNMAGEPEVGPTHASSTPHPSSGLDTKPPMQSHQQAREPTVSDDGVLPCHKCGKTESHSGNEMLLCDSCEGSGDEAWHRECLPEQATQPGAGVWLCPRCRLKPTARGMLLQVLSEYATRAEGLRWSQVWARLRQHWPDVKEPTMRSVCSKLLLHGQNFPVFKSYQVCCWEGTPRRYFVQVQSASEARVVQRCAPPCAATGAPGAAGPGPAAPLQPPATPRVPPAHRRLATSGVTTSAASAPGDQQPARPPLKRKRGSAAPIAAAAQQEGPGEAAASSSQPAAKKLRQPSLLECWRRAAPAPATPAAAPHPHPGDDIKVEDAGPRQGSRGHAGVLQATAATRTLGHAIPMAEGIASAVGPASAPAHLPRISGRLARWHIEAAEPALREDPDTLLPLGAQSGCLNLDAMQHQLDWGTAYAADQPPTRRQALGGLLGSAAALLRQPQLFGRISLPGRLPAGQDLVEALLRAHPLDQVHAWQGSGVLALDLTRLTSRGRTSECRTASALVFTLSEQPSQSSSNPSKVGGRKEFCVATIWLAGTRSELRRRDFFTQLLRLFEREVLLRHWRRATVLVMAAQAKRSIWQSPFLAQRLGSPAFAPAPPQLAEGRFCLPDCCWLYKELVDTCIS